MLSFFYEVLTDPLGDTVASVFWFEPHNLSRFEFPEDLSAERRERPVALTAEGDFTLFPWAPPHFGDEERIAYAYDVPPDEEDLHRMLGYPDLIQDTPAPDQATLLLQIDFYDDGSFPGGAGRLYFLISEDDLVERRFDRAWCDYECD